MKHLCSLFSLFLFILSLNYAVATVVPPVTTTHPFLKFFKQKSVDIIEKAGVSSECSSNLKSFVSDLLKRKLWAVKMLDASAKIQAGLVAGNVNQIGNFDECLSINEITEYGQISGQYCNVILGPRANFTSEYDILFNPRELSKQLGFEYNHKSFDYASNIVKGMFGICIPKSCTIGNLQNIWNYMEHTFALPFHANFADHLCSYKGKNVLPYDVDKYSYAFFAVVLSIVALSTLYDLIIHQHLEDKEEINIWVAFSLYTNFRKIFSFNTHGEPHLSCLNGIKVFSMLTVMLGHRTFMNMLFPNINSFSLFEWAKELKTAFYQTGTYSVDTFFVLSGFLLSYGYAVYTQTLKMKLPWIPFYLYRFLRIMPALTAVVLFYISIIKDLNEGPLWPVIAHKFSASCLATWWGTLFFVNNAFSFGHQCVEQTWYLSADTQLYMISPIFLIYLYKKPKHTAFICFLICTAVAIYAFSITYIYEYGATYNEGNRDFQQYIYQPTLLRMPSWIIGLFLGYILHNYKRVNIPKVLNMFLWILSVSTLLFLVIIFAYFGRTSYNPLKSAVYNALARPLWSLSMASIIFLCATGNGGGINRFLSYPVFAILARLSYSIYLTHVAVIVLISGGNRHPGYFGNLELIHGFSGDILFIFAAASIWCLIFESPFVNIGKIFYRKEIKHVLKNMETKVVPYNKKLDKRTSHKKRK